MNVFANRRFSGHCRLPSTYDDFFGANTDEKVEAHGDEKVSWSMLIICFLNRSWNNAQEKCKRFPTYHDPNCGTPKY